MVTARRTQTVLVTGGAGFIGSHTCVELLEHGYEVVVVDDYSNSTAAVIPRIEKVAGRPLLAVYEVDILDRRTLAEVFRANPIDAVLHFAAKKAVGESVRIPFEYYDTNVGGLTALLRAMADHGVRRLVFSSSCSIYGNADALPIGEQAPRRPTNPYAASKWICEQVLTDAARHCPELAMIALRYFNPAGAHPSGLIGEVPRGAPNNVMPFLTQVAIGRQERLSVFGDDYPTPDGTAVRDYVHVMDVAQAHRIALERLAGMAGWRSLNLGTGVGTSVLELIRAFAAVSGRSIPYEILGRRDGDVAALVADPSEAARVWGWRTTRDIDAMCRDAWRFQELNPAGYD
jgi:UDP-glucose 4-epimerase